MTNITRCDGCGRHDALVGDLCAHCWDLADAGRLCVRCLDVVGYVASDGLCDGCVEDLCAAT